MASPRVKANLVQDAYRVWLCGCASGTPAPFLKSYRHKGVEMGSRPLIFVCSGALLQFAAHAKGLILITARYIVQAYSISVMRCIGVEAEQYHGYDSELFAEVQKCSTEHG